MREHYLLSLTSVKEGAKVSVMVHHILALWPQKDGTCLVETTKGEMHVTESEEAIVRKASAFNVIVRLT